MDSPIRLERVTTAIAAEDAWGKTTVFLAQHLQSEQLF